MTLLNETDILSQYLEKEVRKKCWEKREGSGYCPERQEESLTGMRYRLTGCLSWELWITPVPPAYEDCNPAYLLSFCLQDCFFYSLVFDPMQKTLLADQGEIRVGCKYQAEIPDRLAEGMKQERLGYDHWDVLRSKSLSGGPWLCVVHSLRGSVLTTRAEWDLRNLKGADGHTGKRSLRVKMANSVQGGDEVLLCQGTYFSPG